MIGRARSVLERGAKRLVGPRTRWALRAERAHVEAATHQILFHCPGGEDRHTQVEAFIARVIGRGGSKVRDVVDDAGYFAVMQDPEGNEFCTG